MEVGAGPGIGDAGDLAQGPDQDGTEGASGGMIGASPGASSSDMSIADFRSAVARALGVQDLSGGVGTIGGPQAQPGSRALEAHDMDTDAVRNALEAAGMFDDPSNTDYSDDSPAYDPDAVNRQVYGAPQALDDPQGTEEGLDAEQEARDAQNTSRQKQEQEIDKSYYDSRTVDREKQANMKAIQDRFGFSPGNPHMDVNLDSSSREALAKDPKMRDPVYRDLAFNFIDNVMDQGPKNSTLENIIGYINKAFNPAFGLGTIAKAILDSLGFNVNPNLGQRALAAATTAYEGGIPGEEGAGGLMQGERNDSFGEEQAIKLLQKLEPWTRGLNQRQINYYFDRPSELEWVRNLYNQMNPDSMMTR
jgi:hypothetical protein